MASARSRRLFRSSAVAVSTMAAAFAGTAVMAAPASSAPRVQEPGVTASLWEWNWDSVARECPRLDRDGYDGVQVAPPQNSVKRTAADQANPGTGSTAVRHPWWEVYQVVDYKLTSRMGNEADFKAMVTACRKAGVKVYVDAVINHTTGQGSTSYGGNGYTPYNYPAIPYVPSDFHVRVGECPSSDGGIQDFNSKTQLRNCNLVGLEDLRTETTKVQRTLAAYLNRLIGYGVSGFRVDAAKHVAQADLNGIYNRLNTTKDGRRPYWALEVGPGSPGVSSPEAYTKAGDVLGIEGAESIFKAFKSYAGSGNVGDISGLSTFGSASGLTSSGKTMSFITNHDLDRNPGVALTHKDGAQYRLATQWLLADGYGSPQVYSSFTFPADDPATSNVNETAASPPSNAEGLITDTNCANGAWTCDHRRHSIVSMVRFTKYVAGSPKRNVYNSQLNVLAFSRGSKGWAGFNNNTAARTITVKTGLARGTYCDIISGGKAAGGCTGTRVVVRSDGRATVELPARGSVAFTKKDRL